MRRLLALSLLLLGSQSAERPQIICLIPFANTTTAQVQAVKQAVTEFYHLPVAVLPTQQLPPAALCPVRHRYRAQVLLNLLAAQFPASAAQTKLLALTTADIEVENPPRQPHWGVFGLANRVGGNECVVSTFRLGSSTNRLVKVSLHEVGHTLHLPHCTSGTPACFMNDAQGRAATVDASQVMLCPPCREKLRW